MIPRYLLIPAALLAAVAQGCAQNPSWQDHLTRGLPLLGKHNWIVIAEAAYPMDESPGVEVAATGMSEPDLLTAVMDALAHGRHVRPIFHTDAELPFVAEQDAMGIGAYRAQLANLLKPFGAVSLPHDQNVSDVTAASRNYRVLVLKSTSMLPYSSVYIELESGYWSADAERRLRAAMMQGK